MNKLLIALLLGLAGAPALAQVQLPGGAPRPAMPPPNLAPGLYVQVIDGLIQVSNPGGTQQFAAGQFGYTPNPRVPPVIVPKNPGLQFTPPPVFNAPPPGPPNGSAGGKANAVDCEVR